MQLPWLKRPFGWSGRDCSILLPTLSDPRASLRLRPPGAPFERSLDASTNSHRPAREFTRLYSCSAGLSFIACTAARVRISVPGAAHERRPGAATDMRMCWRARACLYACVLAARPSVRVRAFTLCVFVSVSVSMNMSVSMCVCWGGGWGGPCEGDGGEALDADGDKEDHPERQPPLCDIPPPFRRRTTAFMCRTRPCRRKPHMLAGGGPCMSCCLLDSTPADKAFAATIDSGQSIHCNHR